MKQKVKHKTYPMIDLNTLKPHQLNNQETFDEIRAHSADFSFGSDMGDTLDFVKKLEELITAYPELATENAELYKEYHKLIILLKYYAFPLLTEKEIFDLLKNNLLMAFNYNVDLQDRNTLLYMLYAPGLFLLLDE